MSDNQELAKKLLAYSDKIKESLNQSRKVADVIKRRVLQMRLDNSGGMQSRYLPKGRLEADIEYQMRIEMTPYFPESPGVLNDRKGALFAHPPVLDGQSKEALEGFEKAATLDGKSLLWVINKVEHQLETRGWCGVLVQFRPLTKEAEEKKAEGLLSKADEESLGLGMPVLRVYTASEIRDLAYDSRGLSYVRVAENHEEKADWDSTPKAVHMVRVIDRVRIRSWRITKDDQDKYVVEPQKDIIHGWAEIPFELIQSPIEGDDEDSTILNLPMLLAAAEADVCATRLLSDIVWSLYILGSPILAFHTLRDKPQLDDFNRNVSRYIVLKNSQGSQEAEQLSFIQLDSAGLELQIGMHEQMTNRARTLGGKGGDAAISTPVEQSGISKAWQFDTGEKRILFLISQSLEKSFNRIMDLVAIGAKIDPDAIKIKFPERFDDLTKPQEGEKSALEAFEKYKIVEAIKGLVRRMVDRALPDLSDEHRALVETQIENIKISEPEPKEFVPGQ